MRAPITSRGGENRRGVTVPERGIGRESGFGSGLGSCLSAGFGSGLSSGLSSGLGSGWTTGATGAACCGTGAPHSSQKLAPSGKEAPHCSQNIIVYLMRAAIMMTTRITTNRMRCFLLMKWTSGLAVILAPEKSSFMLM